MGNYFFILAICDVFVRSRRFKKAFYQAGEADIPNYAPVWDVFTGIFLYTTYYYYGEADVCTDGFCSAAFV